MHNLVGQSLYSSLYFISCYIKAYFENVLSLKIPVGEISADLNLFSTKAVSKNVCLIPVYFMILTTSLYF